MLLAAFLLATKKKNSPVHNELKQQGDGAGKKRAQIRELKQQGDGAGEKRAQIKSL